MPCCHCETEIVHNDDYTNCAGECHDCGKEVCDDPLCFSTDEDGDIFCDNCLHVPEEDKEQHYEPVFTEGQVRKFTTPLLEGLRECDVDGKWWIAIKDSWFPWCECGFPHHPEDCPVESEESCCQCDLEETRKGTNYWECAGGCGKRTCDDCVDQEREVDQDDDEGDGYGCETCRSNGTMSPSKKEVKTIPVKNIASLCA